MTNAAKCRCYYRSPRGRANHLVTSAKQTAAKKRVAFALTAADLLPKLKRGFCEVTGIKFDYTGDFGPFSPSIDRKIAALGYVPDNIQLVVWAYNAAKGSGSHSDVERLARAVLLPAFANS